jgi:hypothetical protein
VREQNTAKTSGSSVTSDSYEALIRTNARKSIQRVLEDEVRCGSPGALYRAGGAPPTVPWGRAFW